MRILVPAETKKESGILNGIEW